MPSLTLAAIMAA